MFDMAHLTGLFRQPVTVLALLKNIKNNTLQKTIKTSQQKA